MTYIEGKEILKLAQIAMDNRLIRVGMSDRNQMDAVINVLLQVLPSERIDADYTRYTVKII